jgi:hypothetical protein
MFSVIKVDKLRIFLFFSLSKMDSILYRLACPTQDDFLAKKLPLIIP